MKVKTKIVIFLTAVLLSLLEFNIIVSCSQCVDLLKAGKQAGYEIIANVLTVEKNTVAN
jgi:hypothetical protein